MLLATSLLFALTFVVSWASAVMMQKLAFRLGLVDKPGGRKAHDAPTPAGGGLAIWGATSLAVAIVCIVALGIDPHSKTFFNIPLPTFVADLTRHVPGVVHALPKLGMLLVLASILVLLGTLDDKYSLPWKLRLATEITVASVAVACGWRATLFINVPFVADVISVLWIVALINSFNMLDNMDGLSAGVAGICASILAVVAVTCATNAESGEPQLFLAGFLLIFVAALLGFLMENKPKAKIFMGDGGAYFIGFILATLTLSITFVDKNAPKSAVFVPVVILATPLYDLISVIIVRLRNHASPFVGDRNHYSHRLVALGLTRPQAVGAIYLTTAALGIGGILLYQLSFLYAILLFTQTAMILALVAILEFAARKKIREEHEIGRQKQEEKKSS